MHQNLADRELDSRKLRHDFANDISSLKLNIAVLTMLHENPEEFAELTQLMRETVSTLESRLTLVLDTLGRDVS